jgi:proteasome lid subunit RPN8/RPN11
MEGFLDVKLVVVPRSACLAMAFAAVEVFPKECMGGLSLSSKNRGRVVAGFASPYQLATRRIDEVSSHTSAEFGGAIVKLADFHSHPHVGREAVVLNPSDMDLENMENGDVEVIISIGKSKRSMSFVRSNSRGSINISMGKFRLSVNAFIRTGDPTGMDAPPYRRVSMVVS